MGYVLDLELMVCIPKVESTTDALVPEGHEEGDGCSTRTLNPRPVLVVRAFWADDVTVLKRRRDLTISCPSAMPSATRSLRHRRTAQFLARLRPNKEFAIKLIVPAGVAELARSFSTPV